MSRPALPRASSAESGFFFCGMMLDPVANRSSSVAQPNSVDAHRQISSPSRDTWTPIMARHEQELGDEVAVAHRVDRVGQDRVEAQLLGDRLGIQSEGRARERTCAHGRPGGTPVPVPEPLDVAQQRVGVFGEFVAERHRLRPLQVRESGGGIERVTVGLFRQHLSQLQGHLAR